METEQITIYITKRQKEWLFSRPRSMGSVSNIIRAILDKELGDDRNEPKS
jgi:hypothetical protein